MTRQSPLAAWPLLLRFGLAGLFLYAGVLKAMDPGALLADIGNYRLVPLPMAAVAAAYLPWLEILAAVAIAVPRWSRSGLLVVLAMLAVFTIALASALFRGLDISCGCFGRIGGEASALAALLRNGILISATCLLLARKSPRPE
jgi:putative oxidoreductase